jgi:hypothetical protein
MSYYFSNEDKAIFENHTINKPIRVSGNSWEEIISYLNQLYRMDNEKIILLDRLLKASLTGAELAKVQDEVAKMLRYPGIDGYIKEKFGLKSEKSNIVGVNNE